MPSSSSSSSSSSTSGSSNTVPAPGSAKKERKSTMKFCCDYCRRDITNIISIKCAECTDFDLCVNCFSVGAEIPPHKNSHDYHVMDLITTPIFDPEWGADEELLLLELIESCGMGNWSGIGKCICEVFLVSE
jgi:transcriptional adapter 2-alpha